MADISVAHTADLDPTTLDAARVMTFDAFESEFTDDDWEHGLGGLHVLARDGDTVIGHAAVVLRRLAYQDDILRAGGVEAVAVHRDHRRDGLGDELLDALESSIVDGYDLGVLKSTEIGMPFYRSRGWEPWRGHLHALTTEGPVPTPDVEGVVLVFGVDDAIDLDADLTCDWRTGDLW